MKTCYLHLTENAFATLESLPEATAFDIFEKLDRLTNFPLMGAPLEAQFPKLKGFRQLIYKRDLRIVYEFDESDNTIYVLAIKDCRQKLPTPRQLRRDQADEGELPLK